MIFIIQSDAKTKNQMLKDIATFAKEKKITTSKAELFNAFQERENEGTTGFEDGFSIPHARISTVKKAAIIIARNKIGVDWKSLDGKQTDVAISIVVPQNSSTADTHMELLSKIASLMMYEENRKIFRKGNKQSVENLLKVENKVKIAKNVKKYDFIAITSCPTGVAHTNMAAEAIEKYAKENNLNVKVERQAAQGVVNQLTKEDVKKAEYLLVAAGRPTDDMHRFTGMKTLKKPVSSPLKNMDKLFNELKKVTVKSNFGKGSFGDKKSGANAKVSPMKALMNGLSYMIPIVIVGGILIAFGLGIGRMVTGQDVGSNPGTFWHAMLQVGVVGINLAVITLGGYTAYALGGRMALAPALILSFMAQGIGIGPSNTTFFNYETMQFGVSGAALSFFGAIAAGFLVGYGVQAWNKFVSPKIPKTLKTIEPIIIVPILFTIIGWAMFSFILYLPLYYLSLGLNDAVSWLVNQNLLWIAGAIGGAMLCFDVGGPVNKIAFGLGVAMINTHPEVMGAIAAAGAVAPFGTALGWLLGKKVFRIRKFQGDEMAKEAFIPALFMGFLGISEGAIPYVIKYPKTAIISNVIGGAIAGALSGAFLITDTAAHTGPIIYLLGAVGKNGVTSYGYGLLYILAFVIGAGTTAILFPTLEFLSSKLSIRKNKVKRLKNEI